MRWLHKIERLLLILGLLMLGIYLGMRVHGNVLSRAAVQSFKRQAAGVRVHGTGASSGPENQRAMQRLKAEISH